MANRSRYYGRAAALLATLISLSLIVLAASTIPRSTTSCGTVSSAAVNKNPPWNPSTQINHHGYIQQLFDRLPTEMEDHPLNTAVVIRQVPGDGDCLFHSLAIALNFIEHNHHLRLDTEQGLHELKESSRKLRRMAVECLASCTKQYNHRKLSTKRYKRLFIQGSDSMKTADLLSTASSQYGISPEEYCELMMQDSYWGGGPEIVALCAVLRRPIHVYELVPMMAEEVGNVESDHDDRMAAETNNNNDESTLQQHQEETSNGVSKKFCLRLLAPFGSPKFDNKEPLRILSADSRFPDVHPQCALKDGNHFLAVFPVNHILAHMRDCHVGSQERTMSDRNQRVRGGDSTAVDTRDGEGMEVDCNDDMEGLAWLFHGEWYDELPCDLPAGCELEDNERGERRRSWFRLRKRTGTRSKDEEEALSINSSKSMTRIIGHWINIFVRILAYCGDMI